MATATVLRCSTFRHTCNRSATVISAAPIGSSFVRFFRKPMSKLVVYMASSTAGSPYGSSDENPYEVIGVSSIEGFDTIRVAYTRKRKDAEKKGDEAYVAKLEKAYDRIMMSQLQNRKKGLAFGSFKVSKDIKYADKQPIVPWGPRYSKSTVKDMRINMAISAVFALQNSNSKNVMESNIGKNISTAEKRKFLVNTLLTLKESKEVVYGTLDAWVAWENNFPLASLKRAILVLEKEEQWHRVVQVIKWMLSKGQGTTTGTYEQLIRALEKDNRAEEAHKIWMKKISHDLHSIPWRFCDLMISIYYRNNMLERLVKLFQSFESFGRKYPTKSIVRKVEDAYVVLGLLEEKNKLLEKYNKLLSEASDQTSRSFRKSKRTKGKDVKKTG